MEDKGSKIAIDTGLLTITELLARVMSLLLIMAVARKLGPELMGIYAFGIAFVGIFQIFVNFGLEPFIQREVSRRPEIAGRLMAQVFGLKLMIYLFSVVIILLLCPALAKDSLKRWVILILTGAMFFQSNFTVTNAFFRAFQKVKYEAAVRMGIRLIYTSAGLAAILTGQGLIVLVSLELVSQISACFLGWYLFVKRIGSPFHRISFARTKRLIQAAWEFFLIRIVQTVFNSIDLVMLSLMAGDLSTGFYSTAVRLTGAFGFIPSAFTGAFLPVISRQAPTDLQAFSETFRPYYKYLLIIGIGLAAAIAGLSEDCIVFLFGPSFRPASSTLVVLSLALMITFANWSLSNAIIALNREQTILKIFAFCAGLNILLNLILIPRFQGYGAAWATVASQALLFALQRMALGRKVLNRLALGRLSLQPLLAGAATYALARYLGQGNANIFVSLILTGLSFLFFLVIMRALSLEELSRAWELIRHRR